ncbi:hypothetical protein SCHPADRAFT_594601 [Schizopora paradoxa]|uniref:Uncharacterized protein n=1 Tax=Schizopora paradoxa TaxID=27342 RepID=A0A0H2RGY2_9AGAM|nr:hypothetical protein SCHPADRAFT_594601 [Schizopora paradoxa]
MIRTVRLSASDDTEAPETRRRGQASRRPCPLSSSSVSPLRSTCLSVRNTSTLCLVPAASPFLPHSRTASSAIAYASAIVCCTSDGGLGLLNRNLGCGVSTHEDDITYTLDHLALDMLNLHEAGLRQQGRSRNSRRPFEA